MTVVIQIHYIATESTSRLYRKGEFNLKGKKREQVAYEFWQWIKKETPVDLELEKVLVEGDDITELVRVLEKALFEKDE